MLEDVDPGTLPDLATAQWVLARVLNVVEELSAKLEWVTAENRQLRDENNRLKGEQPGPRVLPSERAKQDHGSERERRERPEAWHKGPSCRTCPSTGWRSAGWIAAGCRGMRC